MDEPANSQENFYSSTLPPSSASSEALILDGSVSPEVPTVRRQPAVVTKYRLSVSCLLRAPS